MAVTPDVPPAIAASGPTFTVIGPTQKVRPTDAVPRGDTTRAQLFGARNEFVSFQVVIAGGPADNVRLDMGNALAGAGGFIPVANVTIYREAYYTTKTASTGTRLTGDWPDALIPSVDPLYGEVRTGFPILKLPAGENRVFWVDVLVPMTQPKGLYVGDLVLSWDSGRRSFPVRLDVRNFTLPSTSSLKSLFKIHNWEIPCKATHGRACTNKERDWSTKGWSTNYDYARLALDNRITIANIQFQTPTSNPDILKRQGSIKDFEAYQLPLINGTDATTRLRGARTTTFAVPSAETSAAWKQQAERHGFTDRAVLYSTGAGRSCDEPGEIPKEGDPRTVENKWLPCKTEVLDAHKAWPTLPNVVTASIQQVVQAKFEEHTDVIVPLISHMHGDTEMKVDLNTWQQYVGNQRAQYTNFLTPGKEVWLYTSCIAANCSEGATPEWEGWVDYTIDAAASQNRAMGWLAYLYHVSGELYYAMDQKLATFDKETDSTAWTDQWFAGGNGDGTLFYPWDELRVGGETPIPIESMRLKLIRNGYQDYEYLRLASMNKKREEAEAIAWKLYPATFKTITTDAEVEAARRKLAGLAEGVEGRLTRAALAVTPTEATAGSPVTARFTVTNDGGNPMTIKYLLVGVRDSTGRNVDFPSSGPLTLQPGQQYTYTAPKTFAAETYTAWAAYYDGTGWPRLSPEVKFSVE
jgi:hypothetical protein